MRNENYYTCPNVIVFSDLDGSLLEPVTYSFKGALPGLKFLRERKIVPVFASSKTSSEISIIQEESGCRGPLICENGGAIVERGNRQNSVVKSFGRPRKSWLSNLHQLREDLAVSFRGFSDWSISDLRKQTGLSELAARAAQTRHFSEPIIWEDSDTMLDHFRIELERINLVAIEGGQFLSIQSKYDKGKATRWWQSHQNESSPVIIALGDGPNDESMLSAADIAVVIKSPKSHFLNIKGPRRVIYTGNTGPEGWTEGLIEALFTVNCHSSISLKSA